MFKKATKLGLRFNSTRGLLTTEDLWHVPLTSRNGFDLDTIAKEINKKIKTSEEESFVSVKSNSSKVDNLKLDIVKSIIADKIEEVTKAEKKEENAEKRRKIMEAIAEKQDESIKGKSIEELNAELEALD